MLRHPGRVACALLLLSIPAGPLRAASYPGAAASRVTEPHPSRGAGARQRGEVGPAAASELPPTPRARARRLRFLRLFAASAMSEARAKAARYLARRYPGQPAEHRRTYQRAGGEPLVWYSLFDVGVRPAQEVELRVDLGTGEVGEV